jgi:hypothetical protein
LDFLFHGFRGYFDRKGVQKTTTGGDDRCIDLMFCARPANTKHDMNTAIRLGKKPFFIAKDIFLRMCVFNKRRLLA